MKAAVTDSPRGASIVNTSRLQSSEQPRRRSCVVILEPYWSFHLCVSAMKFSRPRSCRVFCCSFHSFFSTTTCVAMPAWSVPGIHITLKPRMRCHRLSRSCTATVSAWPRWSEPVTFGGGRQMENFGRLSSRSLEAV